MQGFAPADKVLLFRQKDPKPFSPVGVPAGELRPGIELYGCATRSAQTMLAEESNSIPRLRRARGGKNTQETDPVSKLREEGMKGKVYPIL